MSLMKRTPRTEMVWPSWFSNGPLADWTGWQMLTGEHGLKVEEITEDDHLLIRAELPGIDPERDVEITVADRMLTIRAERRHEERTEEGDGYRSEFNYGSFTRSMMLPMGATQTFGPEAVAFEPLAHWQSPRTGISYPVQWRLHVGHRVFTLKVLMPDQELDSRLSTGAIYWEGAVSLLEAGQEVGRGYLEMTGYGEKIRIG